MKIRRNTLPGRILLLTIFSLAVGVIAASAQSSAQNAIPPTAVQAAKMPQYAAHLAHPAASRASTKLPRSRRHGSCSQKLPGLPQDVIYSNGPINGNTDAWTINFGFITSDSFTVATNDTGVTSATFAMWLFAGDTLTSAELSITSSENGGTSYFDQTVNFTQSSCALNEYGYNVCIESTNFTGPNLNAGTYWVNLQNASVASGNPVYWDENSGPSSASQNAVGTIPSESFTILGGGPSNSCMPEQDGNFSVIHDFTGSGDGGSPSGVAIDHAGNLYGPTQSGGGSGDGTVFKLAHAGSGWILDNLFTFAGGNNGGTPAGVIVGHNGILYGAAAGGLENCNGQYCGVIFDLRPSPTACVTATCRWMENVLYDFTGSTDAWQGSGLVSDQAGNLYGVSASGGAQEKGAVFELTPTIGGWSESILYSFTGASDGGAPTTIIVGNDGNLYGMAESGGADSYGVVFQLTGSGNNWTESVLYNIPTGQWGTSDPHSLIQDSARNLYGIYQYPGCCDSATGLIFMLSPSNGSWVFTELHHGNANLDGDDVFPNMMLNAAGNLYGTESAYSGCYNTVDYGYIFELAQGSGGWQFSTPMSWNNTYFDSSGALAMDAQGNLYGTTSDCGWHNQGTVWMLSATQ
ncbi:MAG: choice-of-anchor tandem repeat GloVer-containing protein [Candidatus Korobacteraceae bacterium]